MSEQQEGLTSRVSPGRLQIQPDAKFCPHSLAELARVDIPPLECSEESV